MGVVYGNFYVLKTQENLHDNYRKGISPTNYDKYPKKGSTDGGGDGGSIEFEFRPHARATTTQFTVGKGEVRTVLYIQREGEACS